MEAYERAKAAGLSEDSMQILEEHYFDQAAKSSSPGVARQYWEDKIKQKATRRRLIELMDHHFWTSNWNAALPIATRLVQEYPDEVKGHNKRAQIHEKLGLMAEARQDYLNAAALGDDLGIQELIMANLRGGLGITERSFDRVYELCRYGAYLGSPSALNCVGSLYHEGGRPGIPFKPDPGQSLAWHLLAARAGHYNSQHDFGWLLFSGRGGGIDPTLAKRHGVFWLRRAAEQNHHYAQLRLDENRISREESIGDSGSAWQDYFYMIASMISRVLTGGWL
jgi:TPR repeat protein